MSTAKTKVNQQLVEDFLKQRGVAAAALQRVEGGEISQAFSFTDKGGQKILRINSMSDEGFRKDQFAVEHFASGYVPVPAIEAIGELEPGVYFAISTRAPGQVLYNLPAVEVSKLMPDIVTMVTAIHATPPVGEGYGWWRADGSGKFSSWREALDEMQKAEDDHKLPTIPFFEKDLHEQLTAQIVDHYQYCPEDRYLLHGDLVGNVLSDGDQLTGIIDWHSSMYGDPLWDVAWLEFWDEKQIYAPAFRQHYAARGPLPTHYDERLTCYKLIVGANSLCFFAKSEQPEKYEYAKNILTGITPKLAGRGV